MTVDELQSLERLTPTPVMVSGAMLSNQVPRTLIWGYNVQRDSFHVYLDDTRKINVVVYDNHARLLVHEPEDPRTGISPLSCIPDKRVYPEASDFEFCRLLVKLGHSLPFTTYNPDRDLGRPFHGKRREALVDPYSSGTPTP